MTPKPRILHVLHTSFPHLCGYSIRSDQILALQVQAGMDVAVVTSAQQPVPNADEQQAGITYYRTPTPGLMRSPVRECQLMWSLFKRLVSVIRVVKPDLVHAHSPVLVGIPAYLAARWSRKAFVYEVRDLWENASVDRGKFSTGSVFYRVARFLETWLLRRADSVFTIGEALRGELAQRTTRPVTVIPNGTNPDAFVPAQPEPSWIETWNPQHREIIAYIGSFQPYEGLAVMIRAIRPIVGRRPMAHLLIAGDGPERAVLEKLAQDEGVANHVTFVGRVPHHRVKEIYAISDLLVYPRIETLTTSLTTPLKPLEALSMEKAVLASNLPAIRELITDQVTGRLFKPDDPVELADRAVELLEHPELREQYGKAGRKMVLRERTWAGSVAKYGPEYSRLIPHPGMETGASQ